MRSIVMVLVVGMALSAGAGNAINPDAFEFAPVPWPVQMKNSMDNPVPFDATTTVTVECPDESAVGWLSRHYKEWYGSQAPKVLGGSRSGATSDALERVPAGDEAYTVKADASGVKIAARTLAGVRWAAYSIRQMCFAKPGTLKTEGRILPTMTITDYPHLAFRAVHLCWFPEVRPQQMERAIRLAALLKFNYAIIEPWGMYESKKHPWWHWPNPTMTQAEVKRLVAIGRDLGITLIPQINCFGHASSSRSGTLKHMVLDFMPEYEPLFEPGGWNWCLTNPETQRVLRELIAEMHENFGNPPFFHLGCDEAQQPSCPECRKVPYGELVCRHITGLAEFVKSRGAKPMIWHDMLLEKGDKRWEGFTRCGSKATATLVDTLPKDVIICDWQYRSRKPKEDKNNWPTLQYFHDKGFPVVGCPSMNTNAMRPMADYIAKMGGFGMIETTWHLLRGSAWENMYKTGAAAAWGTKPSGAFKRSLRTVSSDMKVKDYLDTGHLNHQISPVSWQH